MTLEEENEELREEIAGLEDTVIDLKKSVNSLTAEIQKLRYENRNGWDLETDGFRGFIDIETIRPVKKVKRQDGGL